MFVPSLNIQWNAVGILCFALFLFLLSVLLFFCCVVYMLLFACRVSFQVKKEGFGGGGKKTINFQKAGTAEFSSLKTAGGKLIVSIGEGLPNSTSE